MIYLTSDIHGCFREFKKILKYLNFGPEDFLYIIGDVVDRGKEPLPLLQYVMAQPNMELLMGNHEQGFLWNVDVNTSSLSDADVRRYWLLHGGRETYTQYMALPEAEQRAVVNYLRERPMYKIIGKNILVHAGVFTEGIEYHSLEELMKQQQSFKMLWEAKAFYGYPLTLNDPEARVFFGHTFSLIIRSDRGEPLDSTEIWRDENRIGLDCGYAFGGKIAVYCLDDDSVYYLTSTGKFYRKEVE
jgi:serine/threonine protein phosphatase 1